MMRLALVFSGQGQQTVEHLDWLRAHAQPALAHAAQAALGAVWTRPDGVDLATNQIAQPLIFAYQLAWWQKLAPQLPTPVCAAGYSLGEMAACAAAGLFAADAGVALCAQRAQRMDAAATALGAVAMTAVLGLDQAQVTAIAARHGLALAIRNASTHCVVTGPATAVTAAGAEFVAAGATRLTPVAVQTPSHTSWLADASAGFAAVLAEALAPRGEGPLTFPVVSAIDGRLAYAPADAARALAAQISAPLLWDHALAAVVEMRPDVVLEIGPGNALTKMLAEQAPQLPVRSVGDFKTPDGVVAWLERHG